MLPAQEGPKRVADSFKISRDLFNDFGLCLKTLKVCHANQTSLVAKNSTRWTEEGDSAQIDTDALWQLGQNCKILARLSDALLILNPLVNEAAEIRVGYESGLRISILATDLIKLGKDTLINNIGEGETHNSNHHLSLKALLNKHSRELVQLSRLV